MKTIFYKSNIILLIYLTPLLIDVFLPGSLELKMTLYYSNLAFNPFFIIIVLFSIYFFLKSISSSKMNYYSFLVITSFVLYIVFLYVSNFSNDNTTFYSLITILSPWIYSGNIKFNITTLTTLFWILNLVIFFLLFQIVLLGLGFLSINIPTGQELGIEGEMSRISTTFGASTTTGTLIFLVVGVNLCLSKILYPKLNLWIIYVFLSLFLGVVTFSRGLLLMSLLLFCLIFIGSIGKTCKKIIQYISKSIIDRTFVITIIMILLLTFSLINVSNSIDWSLFERPSANSDNPLISDTGRKARRENALIYFESNNYPFGNGLGTYYVDKKLYKSNIRVNGSKGSPHNTYVLTLVELGFFGILFLVLFLINIVYQCIIHDNYIFAAVLFPLILVGLNVENIYFYANINYIFFLLLRLACSKELLEIRKKQLISQ